MRFAARMKTFDTKPTVKMLDQSRVPGYMHNVEHRQAAYSVPVPLLSITAYVPLR